MEIVFIIIIALALNMSGALICKYIALHTDVIFLFIGLFSLLFIIYAMRVVFWIIVGKRWQLSFIYPILSINYFLSFLLGIVLFHEYFIFKHFIGSLIIVCGVALVSQSPNKYEETNT